MILLNKLLKNLGINEKNWKLFGKLSMEVLGNCWKFFENYWKVVEKIKKNKGKLCKIMQNFQIF